MNLKCSLLGKPRNEGEEVNYLGDEGAGRTWTPLMVTV